MFIKSCWSILNQLQTLPGDRRLELSCRGMWPAAAGISRLIIIAIKISSCVQMLSVPVRKCSGSLEKFCKKSGEKPREKDQFGDSVEQTGARHPAMCCCCSCRTTLCRAGNGPPLNYRGFLIKWLPKEEVNCQLTYNVIYLITCL